MAGVRRGVTATIYGGLVNDRSTVLPGFAVIDVETTGFSARNDRIIEVAVVVLDPDGVERAVFATLVDPGCHPGPTHVHGITAAMLDGAPTFGAVHPYLAHLLSGRVVIGHNIDGFDIGFLREECRRYGGDDLVPGPLATVDTLQVARQHLDLYGQAKLVDCCNHFGLAWEDHHSALGDAVVTARLFEAMRRTLGDARLGVTDKLAVAAATRWPGAAADPVVGGWRRQASGGAVPVRRNVPSATAPCPTEPS